MVGACIAYNLFTTKNCIGKEKKRDKTRRSRKMKSGQVITCLKIVSLEKKFMLFTIYLVTNIMIPHQSARNIYYANKKNYILINYYSKNLFKPPMQHKKKWNYDLSLQTGPINFCL